MEIYYYASKKFPNDSANSVQILKTCNGIKKSGFVPNLIGFKSEIYISKSHLYKRYNISPINLTLLKYNNNYILNELNLIFDLLKNFKKVKIVHTRGLIFALFAKFIFRKKVVYEIHDFVKGNLFKFLLNLGIKNFDHIIVISNKLKKEFSDKYNLKNITNLPDGVDINDFNIKESKSELREKYSFSNNLSIVTYVGSFKDFKGFFTFLDSVKYIKNKNVLILAIGGEKTQIKDLNKLYSNYSENFRLIQAIEHKEIAKYLKLSDILVIPNSGNENLSHNHKVAKYYTSPLKLFEYMCAKKPIIASNVPAIKEVLDSNSAHFIKPDSSNEIAKSIDKLTFDKKYQDKLAQNAYEKVSKYNWDNRGKELVKIYKSLF